ncbi:heparan-alpha-glucosaminide N-acetyltransferase-like [Ctenocephalides felis]|uniref:heparan-alpha-glucosaminide N-acetyltransferase-like n=1 Tax=Ctenocephalides felis TaxID=7515 RepID=UPI000E6E3E2B|nr:heparan-alpha-glucosaminide N-acetyltransferase-like [Ctenocephalides felis]
MSWFENPGQEIFEKLDLTELKVDEAYLNITSKLGRKVDVEHLSEDCYNCPFTNLTSLAANGNILVKINTFRKQQFQAKRDEAIICRVSPDVGEFGVYNLLIAEDKCLFTTAKEAVNIYYPLIVILFSLVILLTLINLSGILWKKYRRNVPQLDGGVEKEKKRVKSLDTFRGISIVLMIFVNSGGGHYWWIEHATWNGLHVADLVFPFFLWIMGVCIPISILSQLRKNTPRKNILLNILRRFLILFFLGVMLNTSGGQNNLTLIRVMGVLQRFGISYFVVASVAALMFKRHSNVYTSRVLNLIPDLYVLLPQWLVIFPIVLTYCCLVYLYEVPNCPKGYLGPGGIESNGSNFNCVGGAVGYIDRQILGQHMYQHPTSNKVYLSGPFDPEGLLGCLTSILQVFLGVHAGVIIVFHKLWKDRMLRWIIWGVVSGLIGGILCGFSKEEGLIPVNKNLWSLSFVFITACFAFFLLSTCYLLIDVLLIWGGNPFLKPGMNSTIMYVGHSIAHALFPFHWKIGNMNTHYILTIEALWNTGLWVIIAYILYRKNIFLSI